MELIEIFLSSCFFMAFLVGSVLSQNAYVPSSSLLVDSFRFSEALSCRSWKLCSIVCLGYSLLKVLKVDCLAMIASSIRNLSKKSCCSLLQVFSIEVWVSVDLVLGCISLMFMFVSYFTVFPICGLSFSGTFQLSAGLCISGIVFAGPWTML